MKPGLEPGVSTEIDFVVSDEMRPIFDKVAVHQVCATWSLVHFMELAGRKILMQYLEPDEEGVGSHVTIDHIAPARVGRTVRVVATVEEVDERRLVCDVDAFVGSRKVAAGKTVQHVFPRAALQRILDRE
ncbi:MAG: hotdog domain-containing protein [Phycisphaerae bacterium]